MKIRKRLCALFLSATTAVSALMGVVPASASEIKDIEAKTGVVAVKLEGSGGTVEVTNGDETKTYSRDNDGQAYETNANGSVSSVKETEAGYVATVETNVGETVHVEAASKDGYHIELYRTMTDSGHRAQIQEETTHAEDIEVKPGTTLVGVTFSPDKKIEKKTPADKVTDFVNDIFDNDKDEDEPVNTTDQLKDYLKDNLDPKYATYKKLKIADMLWLRQTLAEEDKLAGDATIDALFTESKEAEGFITMLDSAEYIYDVNKNSDYLVAMIDTMHDDKNSRVTDAIFAHNNLNGEEIDDIIYDESTGICYIPRELCEVKDGKKTVFDIQAQLLQVCSSGEPKTSVDVVVNNENVNANIAEDQEIKTSATDISTTIKLAEDKKAKKKLSADDITVKVNGQKNELENCVYDGSTGKLTIPVAPASLSSVEVNIEKKNLVAQLFEPMTVHAISAADIPMAECAPLKVDGVPHEGVVMKTRMKACYWTSEAMDFIENRHRIYGISGSESSEAVLQEMANNIATPNATIDLSNLEHCGLEYPWVIDTTDAVFRDGDGTEYEWEGGGLFVLKCGHITSPNNGYASVGAGGKDKADVIIHIYQITDSYMIVGFVTPESHTQTGMGIFKIPYEEENGALIIKKASSNTSITDDNGMYALKGAKFGVYSDSACTHLVEELTIKASGKSKKLTLEEGTYYVKETEAPKGYFINTKVYKAVVEAGAAEVVTVPVKDTPGNDPLSLMLSKADKDTGKTTPEGGASLAGAEYTFKYYDVDSATDPAKSGEDPVRTWVFRTDQNGRIYLDGTHKVSGDALYKDTETNAFVVPLGTITIQEKKAPEGYLLNDKVYVIQTKLKNNTVSTTNLLTGDNTAKEQVIRGGIEVQKRDFDTKEDKPMAGANFKGITMEIVNKSDHAVRVDGHDYAKDAVVKTFITDSQGHYKSEDNLLPFGSYLLREKTVPPETGYTKQGVTQRNFSISENGKIVDLGKKSADTAIQDKIMRGDFELRKIDSTSQRKMANIQFQVTSLTTNESHCFTTDDNGEYRSETAWIPHSQNTNRGQNGRKGTGDGLWFGLKSDGTPVEVNDEERALPYDTYRIQELPCAANAGKVLYDDTFTVYSDDQIVYLNNIENLDKPELDSQAIGDIDDEVYTQYSIPDEDTVIVDQVSYDNLTKTYLDKDDNIKYYTFRLLGKLVYQDSGEEVKDADGNAITSEQTFKPANMSGTVRQKFRFDATSIAGKNVVVYEYLYAQYESDEASRPTESAVTNRSANGSPATPEGLPDDGEEFMVASHEDLEDKDQTIYFPEIHTTATDPATEEHIAKAGETMELKDVVTYSNLIEGMQYTMTGTLMDKSTGKPVVDADGNEIVVKQKFKPETKDGTMEMVFTFKVPEDFGGRDVVVFEETTHNGKTYAIHADIEDEGQTIHVPGVHTTATDTATDEHVGAVNEKTTIKDIVAYSNVIAGKEYTITGTLMNKETGKALQDKDGKDITASETFTAEETSGSIELTFTIDSSLLKGQTVVAFEDLLYKEIPVAIHADLEDEEQSVHFPEIGTTATDGQSKTHSGVVGKKTTITDTVAYKNLIPGKEYQILGVLMNKETGEPLVESGSRKDEENGTAMSYAKTINASAKFTPEAPDGTVDLTFTLDSGALAGKSTVVFESLYFNEIEVAAHADIKDEGQTVHYPVIGTTATDSRTKDHIATVDNKTTLIDKVAYKNLVPGTEYKVQGTLMNKETKKAIEVDNKPVIGEAVFTPEKPDGEVEVTFTFDATKLKGMTTVVFENLFQNEVLLTTHADLEDEGQTVELPEIKTTAKDKSTGNHTGVLDKKETIIDTVSYKNLIPGKEYTVKGTLMDKETGKAVTVDGKPVTAETKFKPNKPNGTVDLTYVLDSTKLGGKTLVVFEDLYYQNVKICSHADINDQDQSVKIPGGKKKKPKKRSSEGSTESEDGGSGMSPKTGDVATAVASLSFLLISAGIMLLGKKRKLWWFK